MMQLRLKPGAIGRWLCALLSAAVVATASDDVAGPYPELGPPLDIGGNPLYGSAPGFQRSPAIASDGANLMAVWNDDRGPSQDVYAARMTRDGIVLDAGGIPVSTASDTQTSPAVAFDGTNYMVVWVDNRNGSYDIYGTRVTPSGTVLDPKGIAISTAAGSQEFVAIAFDGTNFLVVWDDDRNGSCDIYGARVSPSGAVLDPDGVSISTADGSQRFPAIAGDGANCMVVWQDRRRGPRDIYGARVSPSGAVVDSDGISISAPGNWQGFPAIAFDGTNYMVVWDDDRGPSRDIYGARVSPSGAVLDSQAIAISTADYYQMYPAICFDGANFFVAWHDPRGGRGPDVYGAYVDPSGTVLDVDGIAVAAGIREETHPAAVSCGAYVMVIYQDQSLGSWDIRGTRVSSSSGVLDPNGLTVSTSSSTQTYPAVASDGTNSLVV